MKGVGYPKAPRSIYAELYSKQSHRAKLTPRIARPWRPKMIAWGGPTFFYPNRFYEMDQWYKANIRKPDIIPQLHIIDPDVYQVSLEERIAESATDGVPKVDIGFKEKAEPVQRQRPTKEMEELAMREQLLVDITTVKHPYLRVFNHFHIFDDLFGSKIFFHNTQPTVVNFGENRLFCGNVLTASLMETKPNVTSESVGRGFSTILAVNIDGNPYETGCELVHWLVSNVEDGKSVESGVEVVPYLQPLPFYGTGYHRFAVLIFHHDNPVDLSKYALKSEQLPERTFRTRRFYKENEAELTPSFICFSQVMWDSSVNRCLHKLGLKAPIFKYEYNLPLKIEQKEFPNKPQPFDLYLDQFRDPVEVNTEIFKKRLRLSTVESPPKQPKFPDIDYKENKKILPAWRHDRLLKENTGEGRYYGIWNNPID